jgi:hypothetical protein
VERQQRGKDPHLPNVYSNRLMRHTLVGRLPRTAEVDRLSPRINAYKFIIKDASMS